MTTKKNITEKPEKFVKINLESKNINNWNVSGLFWGLFLVLIGGLALASNLGFISVNFVNLWRLWPLMIIAAGLSILAPRNFIWKSVTILLAVITLCAAAWVIVGGYSDFRPLQTYNVDIKKSSEIINQANVDIKTGASTLTISSNNQKSIAKGKFESNTSSLLDESNVKNDIQYVSLSDKTNDGNGWLIGDVQNLWNIDFTQDLPIDLNIETGASSSDIDLSAAKLRHLSVKTGASSLRLKIGSIEDIVNVNIDSGVSSIVIKVPRTSGIDLRLDNGLTSNNLSDLVKINDDHYQSSDYIKSTKKIDIVSKVGLSTFSIERY